jgi:hypothetical protein
MGMTRLTHVIRKEFLELRQDPRLFGIVILAPIIQLTMLGYASDDRRAECPAGHRRSGRDERESGL